MLAQEHLSGLSEAVVLILRRRSQSRKAAGKLGLKFVFALANSAANYGNGQLKWRRRVSVNVVFRAVNHGGWAVDSF